MSREKPAFIHDLIQCWIDAADDEEANFWFAQLEQHCERKGGEVYTDGQTLCVDPPWMGIGISYKRAGLADDV